MSVETRGGLAKPADYHMKQVSDENPYELSSVIHDPSELVDMKSEPKFTPLPQEPPAPLPRPRVAETNMTNNGNLSHSPQYKNPPSYRGHSQHGNHLYEEVGHRRRGVEKQVSKDSEYGSPSSQSHTEADQAILFSQSTTSSLAPLTTTDTVERKPRKKVNPLYDSYREEKESAEKCSTSSLSTEKDASKPATRAGCIGSILRHPCTTFFLFLLLLGLIVLFVLLLMGTISSKGPESSYQTQPNNASTTEEMARLRRQVSDQEDIIQEMMAKIESLEMAISSPGSENASVNAKVAYNTLQIMNLGHNLTILTESMSTISTKADLAYATSSTNTRTLAAYKTSFGILEGETRVMNASINTLAGNLQTHSIDINAIQGHNDDQDNQLTVLESEIDVVDQRFQLTLDNYNDTIFQEMSRISKMQGPRGFNGSDGASLEGCTHVSSSAGTGTGSPTTSTLQISAGSNEIITGITCSTDTGERALLKTDDDKFYCECSGVRGTSITRYCIIHYWKCPIT